MQLHDCAEPHAVTWVWDRKFDKELANLRESGATFVAEVIIFSGDESIVTAVGFKTREDALSYMAWAQRHYFDHHGATAIETYLCGADEYSEGQ